MDPTRYQRACEVVGYRPFDGNFVEAAEEWLMQGLGSICLLKSGSQYAVIFDGITYRADSLSHVLAEAVLAVAGEHDG